MVSDTPGPHHVMGVVEDVQAAIDRSAGTPGLRLAVQTVDVEGILQHHRSFGAERTDHGRGQ